MTRTAQLCGSLIHLGVFPHRSSQSFPDLGQLPALFGQFNSKTELAALPRPVGSEPALVFFQSPAIALPLTFEVSKRMLEARDRAERCDSNRQFDLVIRPGALKEGLVAVIIASTEALTVIEEVAPPMLAM